MEKAILSKSTFIKGSQCLKALYLYKNSYFLRDKMPAERVAVFTRGTQIGLIAQQLFPGGIDCKSGGPRQYMKAIEKTQNAINSGDKVLYEAAFLNRNTLIYLDILVKDGNDWHAYEVKSSLQVSETYKKDAALQNFIIKESGLDIKTFNLVMVDGDYVLEGNLNHQKLFKIFDVSEFVNIEYEAIRQNIDAQLDVLNQAASPKINIGLHCYQPYDCDFIGHCWNHIPKKNIFKIPSLNLEEQFNLFNFNPNIEEIELNKHGLEDLASNQIIALLENKAIIDYQFIENIFKNNSEINLIKLLSFKPSIPIYEGAKPYQTVIYGYSLNKLDSNFNQLNQSTYLSNSYHNPTFEVIQKLKNNLNPKQINLTFEDSDAVLELISDLNLYNIKQLLQEGKYFTHEIVDYKFETMVKALIGKTPWFKKLIIDAQAGMHYADLYENGFTESEPEILIIDFAQDWMNYFEKMIKQLKTLNN